MGGSCRGCVLLVALYVAALCAPAAGQPRGLAEEGVTKTLQLSDVPGCNVGSAGTTSDLRGGITGECVLEGIIGPDAAVVVEFNMPTAAASPSDPAPGTFDLLAQLRTVGGTAHLGIMTPKGTPPPDVDFAKGVLYATDRNAEEFIGISAEWLKTHHGYYALNVTSTSDSSVFFSLQVHTPLATTRLIEEEVAVLRELGTRCCPPGPGRSQFCSKLLPDVVSPSRPPEADICRVPPNSCTPEGRLQQLALAGAGLDCGGKGLPPSFSKLGALQTLDLAYNTIGGTATGMAQIVGKLASLRRAYLRYTNVTGPMDCSLVDNPSLVVLSLTGNKGLTGGVPECYLKDPTLQELYISDSGLTGGLPDIIPTGSPLRVLIAHGVGGANAPGLNGPIPSSIANAMGMAFLDLSNNKLDGPMPPLPEGLGMLNVSSNQLLSLPASIPNTLEVLDASFNQIAGSIPIIGANMVTLNLDSNELSGPLPAFQPTGRRLRRMARRMAAASDPLEDDEKDERSPSLRTATFALNHVTGSLPAEWAILPRRLVALDLSNNDLSGSLPQTWALPRLAWLDLAGNELGGTLPASLGSLPSLVHFDASTNQLIGELGPFAEQLAEGTDRLQFLNLSSNYFDGPVPQALEDATVLDRAEPVVIGGLPAPRAMDLGNNTWGGAVFPMWILEAIPRETTDCGFCKIPVAVNGPDEYLACPNSKEGAPFVKMPDTDRNLLKLYKFSCTAGNGSKVPLLSVLDGSAEGSRERRTSLGPPVSSASPRRGGGGGSGHAGRIAGIVIGVVLGTALLAAALFFGERATRNWRQGWTKSALDGGSPTRATARVGRNNRRLVGAGWGARVAARDAADSAVFGVMPPPGRPSGSAAGGVL